VQQRARHPTDHTLTLLVLPDMSEARRVTEHW
jgi:hypothetical protein